MLAGDFAFLLGLAGIICGTLFVWALMNQ